MGHLTLANGAEMKLAQVVMNELKDKPVRINEVSQTLQVFPQPYVHTHSFMLFLLFCLQFVISCYVSPWDEKTLPPAIVSINLPHADNLKMGKALLGVIVHQNAKGESMRVEPDNLEKLAQTGTL